MQLKLNKMNQILSNINIAVNEKIYLKTLNPASWGKKSLEGALI